MDPAQNPKTIYLNFLDSINDQKVKAVMASCAELVTQQKPDRLYCLFASSGGFVDPGIALYNFLRSLPLELIMHNIGSVDSTAVSIFLAATKRYAAPHSSFLFHGITWNINAGSSLTKTQLLEIMSGFKTAETKIAGIVTERTKLTSAEIADLFSQGETKDPTFALSKGIIDEIKAPAIPRDAQFFSFNLP